MYINNHLVFIFSGDMGGVRGDLGTRKWVRYLHVRKQPFRVYLFRGHRGRIGVGGDLGTRRRGLDIFMHINNHLGFIFLGDMGGTWG